MDHVEPVRGWPQLLSQLDRHGDVSLPSPDFASLAELMATYRMPGFSIAVGHESGDLWSEGHGVIAAGSTPVGPRTAFQACSISKHVAAYGALRLVADGGLGLDDDVNDHLTSWQVPSNGGWQLRVTVRQLLAHTAGLSYNWFRGYGEHDDVPTMVQTLRGEPPANTPPVRVALIPGSRFRYSGSHYAVLQQLMEDVTGEPFDELMRALVLEPVGMADSSYHQGFPDQRPELTAHGHHTDGTPVSGGWRRIPEMAGAGLWTTPSDLVRLELEIARAASGQSPLLPRDLAAEMLTRQVPGGYGLGTEVSGSGHRLGHTGSNVGYNCLSFAWPGAGVAVAVMVNIDNLPEVLGCVLNAAERRYSAPSRPAPAASYDVVGRYRLRDDFVVEIAAADNGLTAAMPGQPPVVLAPLDSDDRYRIPGLDCEIRFRLADGQRPTVEIKQESRTETATRI